MRAVHLLLTGLLTAGLLFVVGPEIGRAQDATSSTTGEVDRTRTVTDSLLVHLSDAKLHRVAEAYQAVEALRDEYADEWGSLDQADMPEEVRQEFLRSVVDVVEEHDLIWQEYRDVLTAVRNAPRLQQRFLPMIGQEVTVTASRPSELDITRGRANGNFRELQAEEIDGMPITSATDAIGQLAGVEPGMSIRGGGADELSFNVDGMSMRMGRDGSPFMNISLTQIEEIHVQTGGFNAEYGNVRSGLINVQTKGTAPPPDLVNVSRSDLAAIGRAYVGIQEIRRKYGLVNASIEELDLEPQLRRQITAEMAVAISEQDVDVDTYTEVVEAARTNGALRSRLGAYIDQARSGNR